MLSKADIKLINSLEHKKYRQKHKLFIAEGSRLVTEVLNSNFSTKQIYLSELFIAREQNRKIVDLIAKKNIQSEIVTEKQFTAISDTITPAGIIALCSMPADIDIDQTSTNNYLFLDSIQDPGNFGTLLRSANWFGITDIALSENCIDAYNPKVVRAAMGAHFHLNIYNNVGLNKFSGHTILGTFMQGESIHSIDVKKLGSWILVIGNEAHGISENNLNLIDIKLSIPKVGEGESLNAAMAGSILLYHLTAPLLSDQ